jgi:hypothetical protein
MKYNGALGDHSTGMGGVFKTLGDSVRNLPFCILQEKYNT